MKFKMIVLENFLEKWLSIVLSCITNFESMLAVCGNGGWNWYFAPYFITNVVGVMFHGVEMSELDRIFGMNC